MLRSIKRKIKLFLFDYLNLKISSNKRNIFKNTTSPDEIFYKVLSQSKGIIHIGAHRGSERFIYDWFGKNVIWIEANPKIFEDLSINISEFKFQKAYNSLLCSSVKQNVDFYISTNDGASSSIYDFSKKFKKKEIHFENKVRDISMVKKIILSSNTLDNFLEEKKIDINNFDHLVLDVQGAELEVLKGSSNFLKKCNSIYVEVSTEEFYQNGSSWIQIKNFLNEKNFKEYKQPVKNHDDIFFLKSR